MTALSSIVYVLQGHPLKLCLTGGFGCALERLQTAVTFSSQTCFVTVPKEQRCVQLQRLFYPKWHQRAAAHEVI